MQHLTCGSQVCESAKYIITLKPWRGRERMKLHSHFAKFTHTKSRWKHFSLYLIIYIQQFYNTWKMWEFFFCISVPKIFIANIVSFSFTFVFENLIFFFPLNTFREYRLLHTLELKPNPVMLSLMFFQANKKPLKKEDNWS